MPEVERLYERLADAWNRQDADAMGARSIRVCKSTDEFCLSV
jgi:hypothetical protein